MFLFFALPSLGLSIPYLATLDGASESPSNASTGTGSAIIDFDPVLHSLYIQFDFSDLLGTTTAAHIHGPTAAPGTGTAGVMTQTPSFVGFPLGVSSGTYSSTFDTSLLSSWNPAFITAHGGTTLGAEGALDQSLASGTAYLNIHSSVFPGGEIRGFLMPQPVPEPATVLLLGGGFAGLVCYRRKRMG